MKIQPYQVSVNQGGMGRPGQRPARPTHRVARPLTEAALPHADTQPVPLTIAIATLALLALAGNADARALLEFASSTTTTTQAPPSDSELSGGDIAGILIGCVTFLVVLGLLVRYVLPRCRSNRAEVQPRGPGQMEFVNPAYNPHGAGAVQEGGADPQGGDQLYDNIAFVDDPGTTAPAEGADATDGYMEVAPTASDPAAADASRGDEEKDGASDTSVDSDYESGGRPGSVPVRSDCRDQLPSCVQDVAGRDGDADAEFEGVIEVLREVQVA